MAWISLSVWKYVKKTLFLSSGSAWLLISLSHWWHWWLMQCPNWKTTLLPTLWTSSAWKRPGSCPGPSWCKRLSPWSPWAWSWGRWCPCCWRRTSLSVSPWSDGPWPWWGQDGSYSAIFFLVFGPRNLERHPQLFHVNKIVSHPLRALVDHKQEGWCFFYKIFLHLWPEAELPIFQTSLLS